MKKFYPYIFIGVIGAFGLGWLFHEGKLGSFLVEVSKGKFKAEAKAPESKPAAIPQPLVAAGRDVIKNEGDTQTYNYGLDENTFRQVLKEELKEVKNELKSGTKDERENLVLEKRMEGLEAKLADTKKALEDGETVLDETMKRFYPYILAVGGAIIFVGWLWLSYKRKINSTRLKVGKDGIELEINAPENKPAAIPQPSVAAGRDVIENKGDVHIHNYGLDENAVKEILEKREKKLEKLLKSGSGKQKENDLLKIQLAGVKAKLADTKKALKDSKTVLDETRKALESAKLKNAIPEDQLAAAVEKLERGDVSKAEALLRHVLAESETRTQAGAEAAFRLGELAYDRIDYEAAQDYCDRAARMAPDNPRYLNQAGFVANTLANYDQAIEYFDKALASNLKTFGPEHPSVAIRWNNLGEAWRGKGDHDRAIEYYKKALASDLKILGPEHPNVATTWNNLGLAWRGKGDYDQAIEYFDKALASGLKAFGPEHSNVASTWNNLGEAWRGKGDYDQAIEYFEKALAIFEKSNLPHMAKTVKENIAALNNKR